MISVYSTRLGQPQRRRSALPDCLQHRQSRVPRPSRPLHLFMSHLLCLPKTQLRSKNRGNFLIRFSGRIFGLGSKTARDRGFRVAEMHRRWRCRRPASGSSSGRTGRVRAPWVGGCGRCSRWQRPERGASRCGGPRHGTAGAENLLAPSGIMRRFPPSARDGSGWRSCHAPSPPSR